MPIGRRDRDAQDPLHRHGMAAIAPIMEEATGTTPLTIVEGRGMHIILAVELGLEASKLYTFRFLRVAFGLCNFADHTRVHRRTLLKI